MSGQVGLLPVRMVSLDNLIVESATHALEDQSQDGSMIPGFNGPYHDPDTPVRVLSSPVGGASGQSRKVSHK